MSARGTWAGRKIGVLGLGRSGRAVARALGREGAAVFAFDDRPEALRAAAVPGLRPGVPQDVRRLDLLVVSPGVPLAHPLAVSARHAGVRVVGDIQLFAELHPRLRLLGITGTNGKSTTAALLHHLLTAAGLRAHLGGNIGTPVFELDPKPGEAVVLELSSFQLELCTRLPLELALWLNFAPDHLDRHGTAEAYLAAKRRIFDGLSPRGTAVVVVEDPLSRALADELERSHVRVLRVGGEGERLALSVRDGLLSDPATGAALADLRRLERLRGRHNHLDAAAAFAAARALGIAVPELARGLAAFGGLPHRMEPVATIEGVRFVNDSKATNPEAAARSLACFEECFWIAGGRAKPGGFEALNAVLGNVRCAYLIGEAAEALARALRARIPVVRAGTLARAVAAAFDDARGSGCRHPVVLLAPACASFDQFRDFEERGETFIRLVRSLAALEADA